MDPNQLQHSFVQPSLSPTEFFSGLDLAPPAQDGPRSYKSRKYRPCDFCRARQVACKIEINPPCQLCQSHGRPCTFLERPKKKRRPNAATSNGETSGSGASSTGHPPFDVATTHQLSPGFMAQYHEHAFDGISAEAMQELKSSPGPPPPPHLTATQDASPIYHMDPYLQILSARPRIRPLDSQDSRSARLIGETGESTPYLLRHYRYDDNDECTISKLTYRRIPSSTSQNVLSSDKGEPPAMFMLADDILAQKGEPRVEDDVLAKARTDIANMCTEQEALRLVDLFFRFVYPYFPILCKSEVFSSGVVSPTVLQATPLSLLSAIYATAVPFMLYDDLLATTIVHSPPPIHQLFRISWLAITQELHTPRLATLQACLLLLQRAPTNRYTTDTPWKTSLVGWTVSLAQSLGLARDCSDWITIPSWEIALRRRLWYGVFIMDKWASLGAGMPSHISKADFDVLPLFNADFELPSQDASPNGIPTLMEGDLGGAHFRLLSELTYILSDIIDSFFSLRATQTTSKDFALSLKLAHGLRTRLKMWNDSLPAELSLRHPERVDARGMIALSGNPSLSLAYIIATMTLFRALLRPLENLSSVEEEDVTLIGSRGAVRSGARECAKEVVEFAENLPRGALDAFWHSWSRANFAIASSFLMQLLITAESEAESSEIHGLVTRWRWAMRIGSGSAGTGLMSLGLLRLDAMLLENGTVVQPGTQVGL